MGGLNFGLEDGMWPVQMAQQLNICTHSFQLAAESYTRDHGT